MLKIHAEIKKSKKSIVNFLFQKKIFFINFTLQLAFTFFPHCHCVHHDILCFSLPYDNGVVSITLFKWFCENVFIFCFSCCCCGYSCNFLLFTTVFN